MLEELAWADRRDVGTLSRELLSRTGQAPQAPRAVEHALDLLTYANAKALVTVASFTFNQSGETRASATETLDALQGFVAAAPNTSVFLQARSWAFLPAGDPAADLETPAARFGMRIARPEWWKEQAPVEAAVKEVVASRELAHLTAGDEGYWRPRFEAPAPCRRAASGLRLVCRATAGASSAATFSGPRLRSSQAARRLT